MTRCHVIVFNLHHLHQQTTAKIWGVKSRSGLKSPVWVRVNPKKQSQAKMDPVRCKIEAHDKILKSERLV
jgi:hypothetical protein